MYSLKNREEDMGVEATGEPLPFVGQGLLRKVGLDARQSTEAEALNFCMFVYSWIYLVVF